MSGAGKVLLLNGSPRTSRSNSDIVCAYLEGRFRGLGVAVEKAYVVKEMRTDEGRRKLLAMADGADILVLVFPLYVDSLPALTTGMLELIHGHRRQAGGKGQIMMAIVNNGFPEPYQNNIAIDICRHFARCSGIEWAGGITIGMGGALEGKVLDEKDAMVRRLCRGLDMAAAALCEGRPVPGEAIRLASASFMPLFISRLMYILMGKSTWTKGMDDRVKKKLYDRPYEA